jgi:hypothetical protein
MMMGTTERHSLARLISGLPGAPGMSVARAVAREMPFARAKSRFMRERQGISRSEHQATERGGRLD